MCAQGVKWEQKNNDRNIRCYLLSLRLRTRSFVICPISSGRNSSLLERKDMTVTFLQFPICSTGQDMIALVRCKFVSFFWLDISILSGKITLVNCQYSVWCKWRSAGHYQAFGFTDFSCAVLSHFSGSQNVCEPPGVHWTLKTYVLFEYCIIFKSVIFHLICPHSLNIALCVVSTQ